MSNVEGYNNKLLVATTTIKIGVVDQHINMQQKSLPTIMFENYWENCENRYCSGIDKQWKLFLETIWSGWI